VLSSVLCSGLSPVGKTSPLSLSHAPIAVAMRDYWPLRARRVARMAMISKYASREARSRADGAAVGAFGRARRESFSCSVRRRRRARADWRRGCVRFKRFAGGARERVLSLSPKKGQKAARVCFVCGVGRPAGVARGREGEERGSEGGRGGETPSLPFPAWSVAPLLLVTFRIHITASTPCPHCRVWQVSSLNVAARTFPRHLSQKRAALGGGRHDTSRARARLSLPHLPALPGY
jgi:hypothetical protein